MPITRSLPKPVVVALAGAACIAGAAIAPSTGAGAFPNLFPGCGQPLTGSNYANGMIINNNACVLFENETTGWVKSPNPNAAGRISQAGGLRMIGAVLNTSRGTGVWIPGNGTGPRDDCNSNCFGSGRAGQTRTSPTPWPSGTAIEFQSGQWAGSGCRGAAGSATFCDSTASYRFATDPNEPVVQQKVRARAGSSRMNARSKPGTTATCDANGLVFIHCAKFGTGQTGRRVTRTQLTLQTALVTVVINNQVNQRLVLAEGGLDFGTWARDPRAEYREEAMSNGQLNNSISLRPSEGPSNGRAQWGALRPINRASTASFRYVFIDTVDSGGVNRTSFTGSTVELTVSLDGAGDNSGSACVVTPAAGRSTPRCGGTVTDSTVRVAKNGLNRTVTVTVSPS
jgi:hypothetical protein